MYICNGLVLNLPPENKPWNVVGNIFSELKKLNAKFFGKVRIVTQSKFSRKVWFQVSFHNGFSRKRIFSTKFIDKVRFGFQFSRKIFSNNLFRKSRREAFSVSSENMLPTTFCGLFSGGDFNTTPTQIYTN